MDAPRDNPAAEPELATATLTLVGDEMQSWDDILEALRFEPLEAPIESTSTERRLFYHYQLLTYVELATHDDRGIATVAEDNGQLEQFAFDIADLESRSEQLASLGFRRIGAWHHDETFGVARVFVTDSDRVTVLVRGDELSVENDRMPFDDHAGAVAEAERWMAELLSDGYRLRRIWTVQCHGGVPRVDAPDLPDLRELPEPSSPHHAVDLAVERLTELHRRFPAANMIMELTTADDSDRLAHFPELHEKSWQWQRLGRWLDTPELDPKPDSSFDYLIERYGTLSWFLPGDWDLPPDVYSHRSNGHAGPTTPLEILPAETYPILEDLANYEDEPDYLKLKIFMSDEECNGYALDTRFESDSGEYLIVWFAGHDGPELEGSAEDEIEPFGYWLLAQVNELTEQLLPWLALVQGDPSPNGTEPAAPASGENEPGKTYLEYRDEKSSKFWEIELQGATHTVRYGKIGTDGRSLTKEFDTAEEAEASAEKLIASKRKKGYEDATEESST